MTLVQPLDQDFLSAGSSFDFSTSFGSRQVWDQPLSLVQALDQDFLVRDQVLTLVQALDQDKYGIKFCL